MKLFYVLILSLVSLVSCDLATYTDGFGIYHTPPLIVLSCEQIIGKYALYFPEEDVNGYCDINNQPALGTIATCLKMTNSTKAIKVFVDDCYPKTGLTMKDFDAAYVNASHHLTNVTADPNFNLTEIYNKPALIPQSRVDAAVHSTVSRYLNYNYGNIFGIVLICYWFLMILLSGLWNLIIFMTPGVLKSLTGSAINKFRSNITLPATFSKYHSDYYYIFKVLPVLIPTRIESLMIAGWLVLVLAFNVCDYHHNPGNTIWVAESAEIGRKIADRTGMEALFLIPTLVLYAGRNNFLQLLSGWNYSRFILVHKWVARIFTLLCMLHAVGMTYNGKGIGKGKYEKRNAEAYVQWGIVAVVAMFLLCFQAMSFLRKNRYELFLAVHIILAVFALVGGYFHTKEKEYEEFYIAAMAIWVFDRLVRIGRMAFFGIRTGTIELTANETVKVTVSRPAYWKPFPGAHAFVYFFKPTMFWQSHPFTIVDSFETSNTITFFVKVKGGMSHGLMKYLANVPGQKSTVKLCVEGPYGKRLPLKKYDTNVFISSGNGIPGLYSEVRDLANKGKQNLQFIWIIRHFKSIEWFYSELASLPSSINTTVYITNGSEGVSPFWTEEESVDEKKIIDGPENIVSELQKQMPNVTFIQQRPNINEVVVEAISQSSGSTAIATCCHASIDDDVRKAVAQNLDKTSHRIDLYDQIQVW